MRQEASLPPVFTAYVGKVSYVQIESSTTFTSSCPACGGDVHPGGEFPDRCTWFLEGKPLGFCRRCGGLFWPDANGYKPDPQELEHWRKRQEQREQERKRSAERALAHLREERFYERYHDQMGEVGKRYWEQRGIPQTYQMWWQLGYDPDHRFFARGEPWHTPSATIPIMGKDWAPLNVKHRLIKVPPNGGKYRYELAGQGQGLFRCNPDLDLSEHVIAVEGEIKAMVVMVTLDNANAKVVGLPGTNPSDDVITELAEADRVTLIMDPGARSEAWRLTGKLGRQRCRVLIPSMKVDDGILLSKMGKREIETMITTAVPAG